MKTIADLDAAIAALPAQIETAVTAQVETQLAPVIASLQQIAASNSVDLTNEINTLQAMPGTVAPAIATSVAANFTPAAPATPAS